MNYEQLATKKPTRLATTRLAVKRDPIDFPCFTHRLDGIGLSRQLRRPSLSPGELLKTLEHRQHLDPCESTSFVVERETPDKVESSKECKKVQPKASARVSQLDQI